MKHLRLIAFLFLCTLIMGCAHNKAKEVQTVLVDKSVAYECGEAPAADPFIAQTVQWTVQAAANGMKVFTLTAPMYQALMSNLINSAAVGAQVKAQRDFYAECIARSRGASTPATGPPNPDAADLATGVKPGPETQ